MTDYAQMLADANQKAAEQTGTWDEGTSTQTMTWDEIRDAVVTQQTGS